MSPHDALLAAFALRATVERYAMAVDRGDGRLFAAQFTEDGLLEAPRGRFRGHDELATVPAMMRRLYDRTHHGVVGMVPVFDGDRAACETYSYTRHYDSDSSGAGRCYEMTLRYDDAFRRVDDAWLLAHRVLVLVGDATYPTGRTHAPEQGARP